MAESEPVVEKSIHTRLRELLQEEADKSGVCVSSVSVEWEGFTPFGGSRPFISSIEIKSALKVV